jgi:protocatechuate 3,4-dioxygenase beta subunit
MQELHDHDRGLGFDLPKLIGRRHLLAVIGGSGLAVALAACGSDKKSDATTAAARTASTTTVTPATTIAATAGSASLEQIPEETAGPYPGDGSNGRNVLNQSGVVRSDIRSSFGSSTTTAAGVPTTVKLTLVNVADGTPLSGAAVYIWHCDAAGRYSMYSQGATEENYLRGVQEADASGTVTFTSIYPACYAGRWPHIHYEVYPSLSDATTAASKLATSQLALSKDVSLAVYATDDYPNSTQNLSQVSLASDMVFSDGAELETPVITGSVDGGYTIALTAAIKT